MDGGRWCGMGMRRMVDGVRWSRGIGIVGWRVGGLMGVGVGVGVGAGWFEIEGGRKGVWMS